MKKVPKQNKYISKQDYGTPKEFIEAVENRWGKLAVDLAASPENTKAPIYISETENSLSADWLKFKNKICWLNPPFSNITPWAKKCNECAIEFANYGGMILFLTPASIGSNWFANYVYNVARVFGLVGRLTFEGMLTPYPKDCILSVFGCYQGGFGLWNWKQNIQPNFNYAEFNLTIPGIIP